jgi:hypothetical protein
MKFIPGNKTRQVVLNSGKTFCRIAHANANDTPTEYKSGLTGEVVEVEKTLLHTFDAEVEVAVKTTEQDGDILLDDLGNQYVQINGIS